MFGSVVSPQTKFRTCKICKTPPEPQANGMLYHPCLVEHSTQQCPLEASESTPEQWAALMGEDRDAIVKAHMAGQADAGVDPSYSNAQKYLMTAEQESEV